MKFPVKSAWTQQRDSLAAAAELSAQLGATEPRVILFFASHHHDGVALSGALRERYPGADIVGCTTAGEFSDQGFGVGGVSALALSADKVRRSAAALVTCTPGAEVDVGPAMGSLSSQLGADLRTLDPARFVGVILVEGLKMREETINEQVGNHAPLISFVGGSAGDNVEFKQTQVYCNGKRSDDGAALLLMEMAVPFTVIKSCSFESTGKVFNVTRADEKTRTVYELDGSPVAEVYARAAGTTPDKLGGAVFMANPMGLVIDGKPWIRSPQQLLPDGGLRFYCRVGEGMQIHMMRSTGLVKETHRAMADAPAQLGHPVAGGLIFNCILRRLEVDTLPDQSAFFSAFKGIQAAGFHTYGESWLGHINQTLTALVFA